MENKTIVIAAEGALAVPFQSLEPFQDNIKRIEKEQYEKLRKSIIEQGFSFAVHVWQHEGHNYIIDGHQRMFVLKHMHEVEGWEIPDIPITLVHADTFADAKRKVLAGASQYGRFDKQGLIEFAKINDIPFDLIVATFDFPDVDLSALSQSLVTDNIPTIGAPTQGETPEMKSGSDQVRQVQLFFNATTHAEFMNMVDDLSKVYETENITDTLMEIVRADYKSKTE